MFINRGIHSVATSGIVAPANYDIPYSGEFDGTAYLISSTYVDSVTGDGKLWTFSTWLRRDALATLQYIIQAYANSNNNTYFRFDTTTNEILFHNEVGGSARNNYTDDTFTSTSDWYHIHCIYDSAQAVAADRITLTINGTEVAWRSYPGVSLNEESWFGRTYAVTLGSITVTPSLEALMADTYLLCDQSVDHTNFAETRNGGWYPIEYTGDFDTDHDFYLTYENNADLGEDSSGQSNDFTNTNVTRSTDTPTS